jgi:hypothetical protein
MLNTVFTVVEAFTLFFSWSLCVELSFQESQKILDIFKNTTVLKLTVLIFWDVIEVASEDVYIILQLHKNEGV